MTVAGLFEHPLPLHGQAGRENVTTERHTLPGRVAHRSRRQAHQGQVVVVAVGVVARVEDDLIHGVLLLVLLRDQGMVVAHSDLVLLGAVSIPAAENRGTEGRQAALEKKNGGKGFCVRECSLVMHKPWGVKELSSGSGYWRHIQWGWKKHTIESHSLAGWLHAGKAVWCFLFKLMDKLMAAQN